MSVQGMELFKERFADFPDRYALIGGSACDLIVASRGLQFRRTKDLDIVILADRPAKDFAQTLWAFIGDGGYTCGWRNDNDVHFYRFTEPTDNAYPHMIELFARHPDFPLHNEDSEIGPLPLDEDVSSLSAILLNDAYYNFLTSGLDKVDGISIVDAAHIIPLKARAHIDLNDRKRNGQHVNSADLKKHKKDVMRLIAFVPAETHISLDPQIARDMQRFVAEMREENMRVDQLDIGMTLEQALDILEVIYKL